MVFDGVADCLQRVGAGTFALNKERDIHVLAVQLNVDPPYKQPSYCCGRGGRSRYRCTARRRWR
jgi:hypothetical protein